MISRSLRATTCRFANAAWAQNTIWVFQRPEAPPRLFSVGSSSGVSSIGPPSARQNLPIVLSTDSVRIFNSPDGLNGLNVLRGEPVFGCARDYEVLVPRVRLQVGDDGIRACHVRGRRNRSTCGFDLDDSLDIATPQALRAVKPDLLVGGELEHRTPHDIRRHPSCERIALAGLVSKANFMKTQDVRPQLGHGYKRCRWRPVTQPART